MKANVHYQRSIRRRGIVGICAILGVAAMMNPSRVRAQDSDDNGENAVIIVNASDQTLTYQVRRAVGNTWTAPYELPAGKLHKYTAPERGRSPLATLTSHEEQPGFIIVRARWFQGFASAKVKAGGTYWYLFDEYNNPRLIRASDKAAAERRLAEIDRNLPEYTAEVEERLVNQAKANHQYRAQ